MTSAAILHVVPPTDQVITESSLQAIKALCERIGQLEAKVQHLEKVVLSHAPSVSLGPTLTPSRAAYLPSAPSSSFISNLTPTTPSRPLAFPPASSSLASNLPSLPPSSNISQTIASNSPIPLDLKLAGLSLSRVSKEVRESAVSVPPSSLLPLPKPSASSFHPIPHIHTVPSSSKLLEGKETLEEKKWSYESVFAAAGGDSAILKFKQLSDEVQEKLLGPKLVAELQRLFPITSKRGYSVGCVKQHFVLDFCDLYQQAAKVLPVFDAKVQLVAQLSGGRQLLPNCLKEEKRAIAKSQFKYSDMCGVAWYRLTDLVRSTIIYDDISQMYESLRHVTQNFIVREFNDRYQKPMPGGYRDLQFVVEVDKHLCELQLTTTLMQQAKNNEHRNYEIIRELQAAIDAGDLSACKVTFEWCSDLKTSSETLLQTHEGSVLLHQACVKGCANVVAYLLEKKCNPNAKDARGNTALHLAMRDGHEAIVWLLLDKYQADATILNNKRQTALLRGYLSSRAHPEDERRARALACLGCFVDADLLATTLQEVEEKIRSCRQQSTLMFLHAKEGRHKELARELRRFVDPDTTQKGCSALCEAVKGHKSKCVELILQYGPSQTNRDEALLIALREPNWDLVKPFLKFSMSLDVLQEVMVTAAKVGEIKPLELLLRSKPPLEIHREAFRCAVKSGQVQAAELLGDCQSSKELSQLVRTGDWKSIEVLLHLPLIYQQSNRDLTMSLLVPAARAGQGRCVELLLRYCGPSVHEQQKALSIPGLSADVFALLLRYGSLVSVSLSLAQLTDMHISRLVEAVSSPGSLVELTLDGDGTWPDGHLDSFSRFGEALRLSQLKKVHFRTHFIPVADLVADSFRLSFSLARNDRIFMVVLAGLLRVLARKVVASTATGERHIVSSLLDLESLCSTKMWTIQKAKQS